jgi:hypothetical protein
MSGGEQHRGGIVILKNKITREHRTLPNGYRTTRCTIRREIFKTVESEGAKLTNESRIKMGALSFLKANNIIVTFCDSIPY